MNNTIQKIFKQFGEEYLATYNPTKEQLKVYNQILKCRTEKSGTRIYKCDTCGHRIFTYNSCKDRHCPNCQDYRKEVWIEKHQEDILNIPYFHVVMTIPAELHPIFYHNKGICYKLLFKASEETIMELSEDNKYLGAKVGITAMLHTWNQVGDYHPHIHMIVTGGGINKLGEWKKSKEDYFLPVKVISKKFKGKLLSLLKEEDLKFYNKYEYLNDKEKLKQYLSPLYKKEWVCYSKEPFKNVGETYKYLGRYAFKVCMSNDRILKIDKENVYFKYQDRKNNCEQKIMKLRGKEFIRRFLMHTLPKSFMKIRYYGIIAGKNKKKRLKKIRKLTKTQEIKQNKINKVEILNRIIGRDVTKCQKCNEGTLILIHEIIPEKPPDVVQIIKKRRNA